tara:strand:+ start:1978 stop:2271 length:294 start_codon:yes stop_codon:yes gene_type:complete
VKRRTKDDAFDLLEHLNTSGVSWRDLAVSLVQADRVDNAIENLEFIMRMNDIEDPLLGKECENEMFDAGVKAREMTKAQSHDVWEFNGNPCNDPRNW